MFKEIDLSRAVPPNTVAMGFRYQIQRRADEAPPVALLVDNAEGHDAVLLPGDSGRVTVRLRTAQELYCNLADPQSPPQPADRRVSGAQ